MKHQCSFISDGELRLNHYNLGQQLGATRDRCLVLFDELEDLLTASPQNSGEGIRLHKGWICESLENAGIPTLWTGNSLDEIDPAILRRFTFTLEVGVPPRSFRQLPCRATGPTIHGAARVQMFQSALKSSGWEIRFKRAIRSRLDTLESLTPGDFITAQRKLRFSRQEMTQNALLSALVHEVECKQVSNGRPIGFRWAS